MLRERRGTSQQRTPQWNRRPGQVHQRSAVENLHWEIRSSPSASTANISFHLEKTRTATSDKRQESTGGPLAELFLLLLFFLLPGLRLKLRSKPTHPVPLTPAPVRLPCAIVRLPVLAASGCTLTESRSPKDNKAKLTCGALCVLLCFHLLRLAFASSRNNCRATPRDLALGLLLRLLIRSLLLVGQTANSILMGSLWRCTCVCAQAILR